MSKKQVIRINENQLKQIVTESVKKVLNELDWKTYMNAGKKRLAQKGEKFERGFDLLRHAEKQFNKDYGYNVEDDPKYDHIEWFDKPEQQGLTRTYGQVAGKYDHNPKNVRMQARTDVSKPKSPFVGKHNTLVYDPQSKKSDVPGWLWSNDNSTPNVENNHYYKGLGINKDEEPLLASLIKYNHDRAKEELDAYENGDYEYIKGKGWVRKPKN